MQKDKESDTNSWRTLLTTTPTRRLYTGVLKFRFVVFPGKCDH